MRSLRAGMHVGGLQSASPTSARVSSQTPPSLVDPTGRRVRVLRARLSRLLKAGSAE